MRTIPTFSLPTWCPRARITPPSELWKWSRCPGKTSILIVLDSSIRTCGSNPSVSQTFPRPRTGCARPARILRSLRQTTILFPLNFQTARPKASFQDSRFPQKLSTVDSHAMETYKLNPVRFAIPNTMLLGSSSPLKRCGISAACATTNVRFTLK